MEHVTIDCVYFVQSRDLSVNPIAIQPCFPLSEHRVIGVGDAWWEDTSRGTVVHLKKASMDAHNPPETITLVDNEGHTLLLKKLSLELYNEHVKDLVGGQLEFKNTEELQEFYKNTTFPRC